MSMPLNVADAFAPLPFNCIHFAIVNDISNVFHTRFLFLSISLSLSRLFLCLTMREYYRLVSRNKVKDMHAHKP